MIALLKEVGRGKRGARDLTYDEALSAAMKIIHGEATAAQTGAFLVAERIKMESIDELKAFVNVLRCTSTSFPVRESIDCAGPYDGRTRSFMATLPTAFVLSACGLPVTLHGSPSLPPKWGVTIIDVLEAMGVNAVYGKQDILTAAAERTGLLFVPTEEWCLPLKSLRYLRQELGLRTVFNTAEKLLRFADSPYMAVGVFHGTVFDKMAGLLFDLGIKKGIIVQGMEGSEDVTVEKRTRAYLVKNGSSDLFVIDPELYEMQCEVPVLNWTAEQQASTTLAVLRNEAELPFLNMVLLNSAIRLWVANRTNSIEEGIYRARHAIEQGSALETYMKWKSIISTSL